MDSVELNFTEEAPALNFFVIGWRYDDDNGSKIE